jgi:prevent-host-death family protein
VDGVYWEVHMTDVTSKTLHEKTGQLLDRARQGERFRILRDGKPDAYLVPASEGVDPDWPEIMAEVWKAQKSPGKIRRNPVLKERKARDYGARVR